MRINCDENNPLYDVVAYFKAGNNKISKSISTFCNIPVSVEPENVHSTTFDENDECSTSDLFKESARTKKEAIIKANKRRIEEGECVYGLPKCSKWILDTDYSNNMVYNITSKSTCGDEIENLFSVVLKSEDDITEEYDLTLNTTVAEKKLNKIFE